MVYLLIGLEALGKIANEKGILLGVDNTFASPFLQNPIDFGAHIVMHSVTKFLGGHSDVVMGALIVNDDDLHDKAEDSSCYSFGFRANHIAEFRTATLGCL